jgi:integrase
VAKSSTRARHGSYIFQRPGSSNWYVKLRSPGAKRKEVSLGTPDKLQAEILALPKINAHKAALLAARPRIETAWQHRLEPGREHAGPASGKIVATDKELIHIGHNGSIQRIEPNGSPAFQLVGAPLTVRSLAEAFIEADFGTGRGERRTVPTKNTDDAILETYIHHANLAGYYEREARAVWALYKTLTDSKPLKDASRDDGRKLVAHFEGEGLKSATIQKKIGWLTAAVNLAIKERKDGDPLKLKFNPFSSVVPKRKDKLKRRPLSNDDIAEVKRKLDKLSAKDQLLVRLLGTTGMRLSEAFQIDGEETENGARFVICGHKTDESLRRVPLPKDLLSYLPKAIKGPLFAAGIADRFADATVKRLSDKTSKRLMRFLRKNCGIADKAKVIHSLRHRAQDRLRAAECPQDIRWAILGHEEETVAAGYGEGFAVTILRKWIDKIGF